MGEETMIRAPGILPKTDLDPVDRLRALLSEITSRTKEIGRASCRERVCQYV